MLIKVFGPGCRSCNETEKLIKNMTEGMKGVEVEKVSDMKEMMALGIMSTPAVSIDGKIVSTGKIPSKKEIMQWLGQE